MSRLFTSIPLLALSAASLIARVDSPEDTSLAASSPSVSAGRTVTFNNRAYSWWTTEPLLPGVKALPSCRRTRGSAVANYGLAAAHQEIPASFMTF